MSIVVKVENLSKSYVIKHSRSHARYEKFSDFLGKICNLKSVQNLEKEKFWALEDVSFDIQQGDRVGVIGRNGAGKSTLLKLMSQITAPTSGKIKIKGKIASLLEVGTGFHPELSGRENIYLNGSIIGMSRRDIKRKFDEIVAFSEVSQFLDTPVKHYSSGMYVKLAFAVAAHLDSEILIVDEVLSVGDMAFQKKCMGKMNELTGSGRTLLFVSHNIGSVAQLCNKGLYLEKGLVQYYGEVSEAIRMYTSNVKKEASHSKISFPVKENIALQVTELSLSNHQAELLNEIKMGEDAYLEVSYVARTNLVDSVLALTLNWEGLPVLYSYDSDLNESIREERKAGKYKARIKLPTAMLKEGMCEAQLSVGHGKENLTQPNIKINFEIVNQAIDTTHKGYKKERAGVLYLGLPWEVTSI
ncbi:MAG: transporter [Gammaproteobacteria bacterium]|jgi:lipopolysaccharide transport system ATP-binding protein|nr:transporter [Gammaproteobacteria bacterium]